MAFCHLCAGPHSIDACPYRHKPPMTDARREGLTEEQLRVWSDLAVPDELMRPSERAAKQMARALLASPPQGTWQGEQAAGLYAALCDVSAWLPRLKPAGHDGDEESGRCDEDCQMCQYEAIEGRIEAAFADHSPTPPDQPAARGEEG